MADVDRLLAEFIEAHLAGRDPDPREYLARAERGERAELEDLIDAYLVDAPPRPWDPEAFGGSAAERITESIDRSFRGQSGLWPAILPLWRERARLRRAELVRRLAEALGVADREQKVAVYYHEMEQGALPAAGVSDRVLEALGNLVGQSAASLRRAGGALRPPAGPLQAKGATFARRTTPAPEYAEEALQSPDAGAERAGEAEWDEVDELFRGGPT